MDFSWWDASAFKAFGSWRVGREGKGNLRKWLFGIRAIWKKKIEVKSSKEKNKGSFKEV